MCGKLLAGEPGRLPPGVAGRSEAACSEPGLPSRCPAPIVGNLDDLPYPDFADYFDRLRRSPLSAEIEPILFFEASRGCWWGQKCHCAFCGLNGSRLRYRSKTPRRVVEELRSLADRWQIRRAFAADNIFDHRYHAALLPLLKEADLGVQLMFEMRPALSRAQIESLSAAGIGGFQLGIETFSTPLLRLMNKGTTAVQNLQTLKWLSEIGAGRRVESPLRLSRRRPGRIRGPGGNVAVALSSSAAASLRPRARRSLLARTSPTPRPSALQTSGPARPSPTSFPFRAKPWRRLAYHFDFDYADGRRIEEYVGPFLERIAAWRELSGGVALTMFDRGDGVLLLHDTRPGAAVFQRRLSGLARAVYLFCDAGQTLARISPLSLRRDPAADEAAVGGMLAEWIEARIAVCVDDRYFALALRAGVEAKSALPATADE